VPLCQDVQLSHDLSAPDAPSIVLLQAHELLKCHDEVQDH
jgi:hypothetical protein